VRPARGRPRCAAGRRPPRAPPRPAAPPPRLRHGQRLCFSASKGSADHGGRGGRLLEAGTSCAAPDTLPRRQAAASGRGARARASQRRALRGLAHGWVGRVAGRVRRVPALLRADVLAERLRPSAQPLHNKSCGSHTRNLLVYTRTFDSALSVTGLPRAGVLVPRERLSSSSTQVGGTHASASRSQDRHHMNGPTPHTARCQQRPKQPPSHGAWPHPTRHPKMPCVALHADEQHSLRSPGAAARRCGWVSALVRACRAAAPPGAQPPSATASRASAASSAAAACRARRRVKARGSKQGRLTGRRMGALADMRRLGPALNERSGDLRCVWWAASRARLQGPPLALPRRRLQELRDAEAPAPPCGAARARPSWSAGFGRT